MKKVMELEVLTPERTLFAREDVVYILAQTLTGGTGILADHASLIAVLQEGPLKVENAKGKFAFYYIEGGFLEVKSNKATILTPRALNLEELNEEALKQEVDAESLRLENPTQTTDIQGLERKLKRLKARLRTLELAKQEQNIVF